MYEQTNERVQTQEEAERERAESRTVKKNKIQEEITPTQNVHYAWAGAPNQTEETRARGLAIHTHTKNQNGKTADARNACYALSVCACVSVCMCALVRLICFANVIDSSALVVISDRLTCLNFAET